MTIIDEFGSQFDSQEELDCFSSIVAYANADNGANDGLHQAFDSFFYWSACFFFLCTSSEVLCLGSPQCDISGRLAEAGFDAGTANMYIPRGFFEFPGL